MCVINVSNKRKTDKWRKICLFPAGFEPATLCMWGTRDNRYTMETCYVCRLLFGFHITGWLPKKWKKLSSHLGVEPRTFGLEVQRAIRCANGMGHQESSAQPVSKNVDEDGIRTHDLWIRSPTRYPLRYGDLDAQSNSSVTCQLTANGCSSKILAYRILCMLYTTCLHITKTGIINKNRN